MYHTWQMSAAFNKLIKIIIFNLLKRFLNLKSIKNWWWKDIKISLSWHTRFAQRREIQLHFVSAHSSFECTEWILRIVETFWTVPDSFRARFICKSHYIFASFEQSEDYSRVNHTVRVFCVEWRESWQTVVFIVYTFR